MGRDEKFREGRPDTLLEMVDDLIFHLNEARGLFVILSITSLVIAPLVILFAVFLIAHPMLLRLLIVRETFTALFLILYLILTVIFSLFALYTGLREYRFLSQWNERFRRFNSLKARIDRELESESDALQ